MLDNQSAEQIFAFNPASGKRLEPAFFPPTVDEIETAARLSEEAAAEYATWPANRRAALLEKIAELLEAKTEEITERAHLETALPHSRLHHEMERTCGQLRLFAKVIVEGIWKEARIDHADPGRRPFPKPDIRSMLIPLGPVLVIGASNFPLASSVAGGDTASALAAGCPVIVKAHEAHPGTSELFGKSIRQAVRELGAPEGVFKMVQGRHETAAALVRHPAIHAVGFTGSLRGGRAIMDIAAARPRPIPVFAEMGSANPVFLLPEALESRAEQIAAGLHASVTLGVGQFCTKPGLIFLRKGNGTSVFTEKLVHLMQSTPPGMMLTANILASFEVGLERLRSTSGVRKLAAVRGNEGQAGAALFLINADTFLENAEELGGELFGPCTLVVECASHEEVLAAASRLQGQLTATIHGQPDELNYYQDLIAILRRKAGRVVYNGFPTGVDVCHAMQHGGPYPAASDSRSTSIGTRAISRFSRPICFQDFPDDALPDELKEANPLRIARLVDGRLMG